MKNIYKLNDYSAYGTGFLRRWQNYVLYSNNNLLDHGYINLDNCADFCHWGIIVSFSNKKAMGALKKILNEFNSSGHYVSWIVNQKIYPVRKMMKSLGKQVLCVAKIVGYGICIGVLVTLPLAIAMFSGLAILSSYFDQFMPGEDYGLIRIILGVIWCIFFVSVFLFDIIKVIKFKLSP